MSGYRAAPVGTRTKVGSADKGVLYVLFDRDQRGWVNEDKCFVGSEADAVLDALYYSRLDALESAAQACEAMGATDAAARVRGLKETSL